MRHIELSSSPDALHTGRRKGHTLVEGLVSISAVALLSALILPAIQQTRERARAALCKNNLRQIGTALHGFESTHQRLPIGNESIGNAPYFLGYAPHLVRLLPHLEQQPAFLDFQQRYSSIPPTHSDSTVFHSTFPVFLCPSDTGQSVQDQQGKETATNYKAPFGVKINDTDAVFYFNSQTRLSAITDGISHTLVELETIKGRRLGKLPLEGITVDRPINDGGPDTVVGAMPPTFPGYTPTCDDPCLEVWPPAKRANDTSIAPRSRHTGGVHGLFADGHVDFLSNATSRSVLEALTKRADGSVIQE